MTYLIIGASSGLGRALADKFAKEKKNLIIASRDDRDLIAIKSDLEIKYNIKVEKIALDFSSFEELNQKLFKENIFRDLSGILFPVGLMHEKDNFDLNEVDLRRITFANYLSIVHTMNYVCKNSNINGFSVVGFGSVSGLVGRNLNVSYAAAKRSLESFFESIAFEKKLKNVNIQFYTLGYLDTNLAFGKDLILPKGSTLKLANIVYKNLKVNFKKTYYPLFWNIIAFFLKIIPFQILVRLYKILIK